MEDLASHRSRRWLVRSFVRVEVSVPHGESQSVASEDALHPVDVRETRVEHDQSPDPRSDKAVRFLVAEGQLAAGEVLVCAAEVEDRGEVVEVVVGLVAVHRRVGGLVSLGRGRQPREDGPGLLDRQGEGYFDPSENLQLEHVDERKGRGTKDELQVRAVGRDPSLPGRGDEAFELRVRTEQESAETAAGSDERRVAEQDPLGVGTAFSELSAGSVEGTSSGESGEVGMVEGGTEGGGAQVAADPRESAASGRSHGSNVEDVQYFCDKR